MSVPPANGSDETAPGTGAAETAATAAIAISRQNRRRLTLLLSAIVAILAVILAFTVAKIVSDRSAQLPTITLQSANEDGPDPFTDSMASLASDTTNLSYKLNARSAADRGIRVVNGTEPGLYGVYDSPSCDVAALSNYLTAPGNEGLAQAWASVFGISTDAIPYYLNTLSPVVLTTDTWVTNHSYTDGRAVPFQAVMQAGTAVLVDGSGVPRVRCACGNPLAPPAAQPIDAYRTSGKEWPGRNRAETARVAFADERVAVSETTAVVETNNETPATQTALTVRTLATETAETSADTVVTTEVPVGGALPVGPAPRGLILPTPASLNIPVAGNGDGSATTSSAQAGETSDSRRESESASGNATSESSTSESSESESSAPSESASEESTSASSSEVPAAEPTVLYGETAAGDGVVATLTYRNAADVEVTCVVTGIEGVCDDGTTLTLTTVQATEAGIKALAANDDGQLLLTPAVGIAVVLTSVTFTEPAPAPAPETTPAETTEATPETGESTVEESPETSYEDAEESVPPSA